jgi:hypothetical protein
MRLQMGGRGLGWVKERESGGSGARKGRVGVGGGERWAFVISCFFFVQIIYDDKQNKLEYLCRLYNDML